jgi:hypothetical protein
VSIDLDGAWFLEYDLREAAEIQRSNAADDQDADQRELLNAAADQLEELADDIDRLPDDLLERYRVARRWERNKRVMGQTPFIVRW